MDRPQSRAHFLQAMEFRHACKAFDPARKIPDEDFQFLLEVAHLSPTSFGFELWRLVVVQDPALRERLKEVSWGAQGHLPTASHFVVLTVQRGESLSFDHGYLGWLLREVKNLPEERVEGMRARFESFVKDDFKLVPPQRLTDWAARQAYIAMGNMMTAAAAIGIDSCPIEGFHQDKVEAVLDGKGSYDRSSQAVVCMLAFGYRAQEQKPRMRRNLSDSVGWA